MTCKEASLIPQCQMSGFITGSYQFYQNIRYDMWYAARIRRHRPGDDPQHVASRLVPVLPEHPLRHVACSVESAASVR